ncbi:zinc finger BED domain-containing protein 4-like [Epinephelus fuscoguttatus]|uniref:zinc finger BED domain-containing protein 4-like n=1 Tax=Epinephelus fuscoguttatus TaxID=293821 RepID=UPI0020D0B3CE|nr:zinc finger BED domain-containing protein 4-like [Epinephelus fuscoguttatus]XP_049437941.1 zinc finger BED domain-containing protein 4-like [Epinephelus fuscoguttatus]
MDAVDIVKIEDLTDYENAAAAAAASDQQQDVGDTPTKKRRNKSAIWKYFTTCEDDVTKVMCNICKRVVSRGKDLGHLTTSTMHNHMHYKHRNVAGIRSTQSSRRSQSAPTPPDILPFAPLVFPDFQSEALELPNQPLTQAITESVGEMICTDLLPYSFVENKGFSKLMNVVAPHYTLPAAIHFSNTVVPQLHQRVKSKVKESLKNIEGNVVHCTADIWTRKFSASSYLSLTGHWFTQNVSGGGVVTHKRVNALLSMKVIDTDYTPAEILQHLEDLVEEWQTLIPHRFTVEFFVTNNTCNMVEAMSDSGFEHIRCMAHSLHLIVTGAIEECHGVVSVINTARQITNTVHMSNTAVAKLHEIQDKLGLTEAALVHDVPTRWNTVLFMLQRLLEQKKALVAMSTEVDLGGSLSEHQWTLMEAIVKVLEPFEEATCTVCQDDSSISSVIPCIQALRAALNKLIANKDVSDLLETRQLVGLLQSHLEEHFQHVFETPTNTYFKATLLDPRFKIMPMALLSKLDFGRLKAAVAVEVEELLEQDSTPSAGGNGSSLAVVQESEDTRSKPTSLFWGAMQSLTANNAASKTVTSSGLVETYLAESSTQSLASDPVTSYWSAKMAQYPALARVAIKYLACPPTSASSERLLSTGEDAVGPDYRLLPVSVPQLVFTKYNLVKFQ